MTRNDTLIEDLVEKKGILFNKLGFGRPSLFEYLSQFKSRVPPTPYFKGGKLRRRRCVCSLLYFTIVLVDTCNRARKHITETHPVVSLTFAIRIFGTDVVLQIVVYWEHFH